MRSRSVRVLAVCALAAALVVIISGLTPPSQAVTNGGNITAFGVPLTEDFNGLATSGTSNVWTDNVTVPGWYSSRTVYIGNAGSLTNGGLYSFGLNATNPLNERALGSVASGTTLTVYHAVKLTNSTGGTITSLAVSYTGEQWRNANTVAHTLTFEYRVSNPGATLGANSPSAGWTPAPSLNFTSPITTGGGVPIDGNNPLNRVARSDTLLVTVLPGQEIWLRWGDPDDGGSDHGLAVDDFSVTASGDPGDTAPQVTGTSPANGVTNVVANSPISINFTEPVTADSGAIALQCAGSPQAFTLSGASTATLTLTPDAPLPYNTICGVSVTAGGIHDVDANDPPDTMDAGHGFSFTTANQPPPGAIVMINELDSDTPSVDNAEFIELFDGGAGNTPLDGLVLVFYNGNGDVVYGSLDLDGQITNASGYFTIGNPGVPGVDLTFDPGTEGFLQNGADAVAIHIGNAADFPIGAPLTTASLVDAVAYDTADADDAGLLTLLNPGQPQVNESGVGGSAILSIQRCANGTGGQRNTSTYLARTPTPDGANTCVAPPPPVISDVVISQVYGGGGNANAQFTRDFVELYNRGTSTVDLTGWSLQYASAAGSSWDFTRQPIGGSIAPGRYYLIALAAGTEGDGAPLPPANISGDINLSATNGKVALVKTFTGLVGNCPIGDPNLMDLVGYGTADCSEGGAAATGASNTRALFRLDDGNIDTNHNAADFFAAAPAPRQTEPIIELGPLVVSTDPRPNGLNAPRDATIQITFTEAVNVTGAWFNIACPSGAHNDATFAVNGRSQYITPNANFTPGETCTATIFAAAVTDQDTDDGPGTDTLPANFTWTFTVATGTAPAYTPDVHLAMGNPTAGAGATDDNFLMVKPEYTLSYNRSLGRPNWVSWHLADEWIGSLERVDTFRPDPAIPPDWYRVQSFDFANSGFDRGHMVPNADRDPETSIPINQATFLMSNMLAQAPGNNQGPWADLENYLRTLLPANELYIVAGGTGTGGTGLNGFATTIANGQVTVPEFTWKVALVLPKSSGDDISRVSCTTRTIAVIMPNHHDIGADDWTIYLRSVDQVEALAGYNLFSNLPAPIQQCVEAGVNGNNPPMQASFSELTSPVVELGAPSTAISGRINAETFIPTGVVVVSVGGQTVSAAIGLDGRFTALVPTASLTLAASPYAVSFSYAGDATFGPASASSTLTVVDTTGPSIGTVATTPNNLGAPNHKMLLVTLGYTVSDLAGATTCSVSVSSNEPINGLGDGNTSVDWHVIDPHHVQLRAERSGQGTGRIYTITVRCTDATGNASTATGTVSVPK